MSDGDDRDVELAPLDRSEVGAINRHVGTTREPFLRFTAPGSLKNQSSQNP
jgi:hypothetical protein